MTHDVRSHMATGGGETVEPLPPGADTSLSPEEGKHLALLAERFVPGGKALVQQVFKAHLELLQGVNKFVEAQIASLRKVDRAIGTIKANDQWKGSLAEGLAKYPVRRMVGVHQEVTNAVSGAVSGIMQTVGSMWDQGPGQPPENIEVK